MRYVKTMLMVVGVLLAGVLFIAATAHADPQTYLTYESSSLNPRISEKAATQAIQAKNAQSPETQGLQSSYSKEAVSPEMGSTATLVTATALSAKTITKYTQTEQVVGAATDSSGNPGLSISKDAAAGALGTSGGGSGGIALGGGTYLEGEDNLDAPFWADDATTGAAMSSRVDFDPPLDPEPDEPDVIVIEPQAEPEPEPEVELEPDPDPDPTPPAKPPSGGCFLSGTPILMSDGSTKPIQEVKPGDKILAFDEKTKELKTDSVKLFFEHDAEEYLIINDNLKVTSNHPVYSEGKWVEIGKLPAGSKLLNSKGQAEEITSIRLVKEPVKVYNLEVNPYHTYIAGGIVAHNKTVIAIEE